MNFAKKLFDGISDFIGFVGDSFQSLFELLAKPLSYVLAFFEGVFYFITKFFEVLIEVIMLFTALFQFLFALIAGIFRTITNWIGFTPSTEYNLPSTSSTGVDIFIEQLDVFGLITIAPFVCIAMIWLLFAYKVVGLIGKHQGGTTQ